MKFAKLKKGIEGVLADAGARLVFSKGQEDGQPIDERTFHWIIGGIGALLPEKAPSTEDTKAVSALRALAEAGSLIDPEDIVTVLNILEGK